MSVRTSFPVNAQPPEKQDLNTVGNLAVFKVWKTLQGEGPFVGQPAVFVRLAGCNLQCPGCDTDYTSTRPIRSAQDLCNEVREHADSMQTKLVVLTGGEPFRQNIAPFVRECLHAGLLVQIETNGTLYLQDFPYYAENVVLVCSPKTPTINVDLRKHIGHLKYVVQAGHIDPADGLPTSVLGNNLAPARPWMMFYEQQRERGVVYVQPMDEGCPVKNKANQEAALESCMKFGYRYCHQLHKVLGLE